MTDPLGDSPATEPDPATLRRAASGDAFQDHVRAARTEFEHQVAQKRAEFEEANARITQRTGRNLIPAILIGVGLGAAVLGSLLFFKVIFVVFAMAAIGLGIFELCRALQVANRRLDVVPHVVLGLALIVTGYFSDELVLWVLLFVDIAVIVVWRLVAQMSAQDGRRYGDVLSDLLIGSLVQLYLPFFGALAMILLRQDGGEWWVLGFIIVAVVCDVGAYAAGLTFGKHPMAPRISPKKTWEGFAGAVAAALVSGVLVAWLMLGLPWWSGLIIGVVIVITATAGDLAESMLKRDLGIKDMSSWLPGHGGVLDRLDSMLPTAAAMLALSYLLSPLGVA